MIDDTRPRVTALVDVNLRQLADELGSDRLSLAEDHRTVVAAAESGITKARLEAAVQAHVPEPEPAPVEPLTDDEITRLRDLLATP